MMAKAAGIEGFFAKLSKRRLKRGVFRSIVDLQAAINPLRQGTQHRTEALRLDRRSGPHHRRRQTGAPNVQFDPLGADWCQCRAACNGGRVTLGGNITHDEAARHRRSKSDSPRDAPVSLLHSSRLLKNCFVPGTYQNRTGRKPDSKRVSPGLFQQPASAAKKFAEQHQFGQNIDEVIRYVINVVHTIHDWRHHRTIGDPCKIVRSQYRPSPMKPNAAMRQFVPPVSLRLQA